MIKVNLGSATECLDDWINIDNSLNARLAKIPKLRVVLYKIGILPKTAYESPWEAHIKSIVVRDVRNKLPFDSNSVDFIYSSHMIEHLKPKEAATLLTDCFRVLKKGGLLRLVTPDLELMARTYLKEVEGVRLDACDGESYPSEKFIDILGMVYAESELSRRRAWPLVKFFLAKHNWIYDELSLQALLNKCGYTNIHKCSYKCGEMPDIEFLDKKPEHSLYMEASKPK